MDILVILYSIVLMTALASPFLYIHLNQSKILSRESEEKSTLDSERKMLLENLKDLKIEYDGETYDVYRNATGAKYLVKSIEE